MITQQLPQTSAQPTTDLRSTKEVFVVEFSCDDLDALLEAMAIVNSSNNQAAPAQLEEIIYLDPREQAQLHTGPFAMPAAA